MPALWRIAEDLFREGCPLEREEIDAEILAGFWEQAGRGEPDGKRLSGRLVGAARFRALNAIRKARREAERRVDLSGEEVEEFPLVGHPSLVLEQARAAGVISEVDSELIAATRVENKALRGVAAQLGLAHDSARVRRWRAEQRLVAWISGRAREDLPAWATGKELR
jgi:DNA-directed RNA polymerase specialized sigma24 family protein